MKYVIYLRVSTKKQDHRTQLENCLKHLQSINKEEFGYLVFSDEITSKRTVYSRTGFQEALRALGKGDVLVAMRLDRIARYRQQLNWVADQIELKKATFLMVEQPGLDNMILWGIYAGMAEEEVKTMGSRIKETLYAKKQRGELTNHHAPYGFQLDKENLIPIKNRDGEGFTLKAGKLIDNPIEKQIIREMMYLFDGGKSYRLISMELEQLGHRNRQGNPFHKTSIQRILSKIGKHRNETPSHELREDLLFHS